MTTPLVGTGWFAIPLKGNALFAGGEVAAIANPEGKKLIIEKAVIYGLAVTSVALTTLAIGCDAASATASSTTIVAALAIDGTPAANAAVALIDHADAKDPLPTWDADKFLTATGSADSTDFDAVLYLKYVHTA